MEAKSRLKINCTVNTPKDVVPRIKLNVKSNWLQEGSFVIRTVSFIILHSGTCINVELILFAMHISGLRLSS